MFRTKVVFRIYLAVICFLLPAYAQLANNAVVPRLVNYSGKIVDTQNKSAGISGVTFSIYKDQEGGAPLWMETQNVQPDKTGHYTAQLGGTKASGLPTELFATGEARWLGVRVNGQDEQPRTLLLSVPYALKAIDAETLGGKPASAFLQAGQANSDYAVGSDTKAGKLPPVVRGTGVANFLPVWTSTNTVGNSALFNSGSFVGINNSSPQFQLDVQGDINASAILHGAAAIINANNTTGITIHNSSTGISIDSGSSSIVGVMQGNIAQTAALTGISSATGTGNTFGVEGFSLTSNGAGVAGVNKASGYGVYGITTGGTGQGVWGESRGTAASNGAGPDGVHGVAHSTVGAGVQGINDHDGYGVSGVTSTGGASGVGAFNFSTGDGLFAYNQSGGFAAFFLGDVAVDGNLSKAGGSFKIDHPLDPANKYLYHSFVESPDMMNIYNGNVTTDADGNAVVAMPDWFEALNRDFRYQLTVVGQFAQAIVASRMSDHHFAIKTDKPNVEVSWMVTGVRHDAWADAHRIPVEQAKEGVERGTYLHPELFGATAERSTAAARHPGLTAIVTNHKAQTN